VCLSAIVVSCTKETIQPEIVEQKTNFQNEDQIELRQGWLISRYCHNWMGLSQNPIVGYTI